MGLPAPAVSVPDQRAVRHGGGVILTWISEKDVGASFPIAGILNSGLTDIKAAGPFCTLLSMDAIKKVPLSDINVLMPGRKAPIQITDGYKIEAFKVSLMGDALSGLYAAIGQNPTVQPGFMHDTVDYGKKGHLLIQSFGIPKGGTVSKLMRTTLLLNACVRIEDVPGIEQDGTSTQDVYFYTNRTDGGDLVELQGDYTFVWEIFADNATVVNPGIPGTTLDVGTGNNSYASATTPVPFAFNPAGTGIDQKFAYISVNGVRQNAANGTTFSAPTVTLPSATVVPATVLMIYALDTTSLTAVQVPNWGAGRPASVAWHTWLGPA